MSGRIGAVRLAAVLGLAGLVAGACGDSGSDNGPEVQDQATRAERTSSVTAELGPVGGPGSQADVDQTPPGGLNGIVATPDALYVASLKADQVLAVDPASGKILGRWGQAGELGTPDDLALDDDGSLVVTGFASGVVSRIAPDGAISELGNIGAGANPVGFSAAGELYVGRALAGDGLFRFDPTAKQFVSVAAVVEGLNGFAFDSDGTIVGPLLDLAGPGRLARIDPRSGALKVLSQGFGPVSAVKIHDGALYGVQLSPPAVLRWSLADVAAEPTVVAGLPVVPDNLAVDAEGTIYVTSFGSAQIVRVSQGAVTVIEVGTA